MSSLLRKLQDAGIGENFEKYSKLISELTKETAKDTILLLTRNNNHPESFGLLLSSAITKINGLSDSSAELIELLPLILASARPMENPISILFLLLESLASKRDEVPRLKVLEHLSAFEFSVMNVVNLLYRPDTDAVILDILRIKENMTDEFIRVATKIDNQVVAKNISLVLPMLPPKFFVNYNSFLFFFESENHYLRNCLLEILQALVLSFKELENIEAIRETTQHISERLNDVNFYVRSKALSVIGELFKRECVLKDQRNGMIREVLERAKDKTVIVRKKSISLLTQILINHPFRDRKYLDSRSDGNNRMFEDYNEFLDVIEASLSLIVSLLDYNLKTDLVEISGFIKVSYLLKVRGSKEAIQKILGVVFTKDKQIVIDVFKEILAHRGDILYEFINDKAFESILSHLEVDEKILHHNILNGQRVFEGVYVLKQLQRPISEGSALSLLQLISDQLFRSKDEDELKVNIETYINTLCVVKCLKRRTRDNGEILTLCMKNVIKMVFFERSIMKHTVELIYYTSADPEATIEKFLKALCQTRSTLKIIDAVGWVAVNEYYLLERIERVVSRGKTDLSISPEMGIGGSDIRERRKSLEEGRRASLSGISTGSGDGRRTSLGKSGNRLSLRFDELEETLKSKTDEEVADFFFYLKEREILYSKTSMLHQFVPLVKSSLGSSNADVQAVAHSTLFKLMHTSSEFFSEHKHVLLSALESPVVAVRNNAITAFHDFLIFYNTALEPGALFDKLGDKEVGKNALLVIFNLLQKNIIRLKGNAVRLVGRLFDDELGAIVKTLVKMVSGNNNAISVIFYEVFTGDLGSEYVRYLAPFVPVSIQESLFLKCLSKSEGKGEKLKAAYEGFELSEKFIRENSFRPELKVVLSSS